MRQRHLRKIAIALGLAALLAGLTMGPVSATYPGVHNGRIAIGVRANGAANIFTLRARRVRHASAHQRARLQAVPVVLARRPDDRLLRDGGRCLRDLDDEAERDEAAPADAPRRLRDLPGLLARRIEDRLRRDGGADPNGEIYIVDARTGGGLHALTSCASFPAGCFNDLPVWSPDGTKIAFLHADDVNARR